MKSVKLKIISKENITTFYTIFYDGIEYKLCTNMAGLDIQYELIERFRDINVLKSHLRFIEFDNQNKLVKI